MTIGSGYFFTDDDLNIETARHTTRFKSTVDGVVIGNRNDVQSDMVGIFKNLRDRTMSIAVAGMNVNIGPAPHGHGLALLSDNRRGRQRSARR
jgi:hypothetical protein